ncbi:MAG TPA: GTP-binding protein [Rhodospirillaceae bacterium]|nr:GTP-binding protein [Rhodospirillaceae bacterium]
MTVKHTLAGDFPGMEKKIHDLKVSDTHFRRLFEEYDAIATELHRFDEGAGGISDDHAHELKKKILKLKDEM